MNEYQINLQQSSSAGCQQMSEVTDDLGFKMMDD